MPQHLLAVWPQIQQSLQEAGRVVLLLDYDGTLAPIVDRPDLASMPMETQEALVEIPLSTNEETVKAEPDAPEDKGASGNKQALEADMEPDDNDVILEDAIESDADAGADDEAPEDAGMSLPIDSGSLDPGQAENGSKDSLPQI